MDDEEKEVADPQTLRARYEALPAEAKGVVAFLLMFLLFLASATFLGPMALEQRCWEFQAKDHRFFKFNTCNGDVIEITEEYLDKARSLSKESN